MIESWHVREALRARFGAALVDLPGIWDRTAALLNNYAPYRDTFEDLAARLEDVIFNTVYEQLGPSMSAQMDNGSVRRIRSAEFRDAADDVMGLLFDSLKVNNSPHTPEEMRFLARYLQERIAELNFGEPIDEDAELD